MPIDVKADYANAEKGGDVRHPDLVDAACKVKIPRTVQKRRGKSGATGITSAWSEQGCSSLQTQAGALRPTHIFLWVRWRG
jgi:hypothetical protein